MINEPGHAKGVELLIKELHSLRKQAQCNWREFLDVYRPDKPLLVRIAKIILWPMVCMALIRRPFKTAVYLYSMTHQLSCQQGHVLYDGEADPPLGILCQLHDGRQQ